MYEKAKVKLAAEAVDYIFQDAQYEGVADATSATALLNSIPSNQTATKGFVRSVLDKPYQSDLSLVENLNAVNQMMVDKLSSNSARASDPRRMRELNALESRLKKMAFSLKESTVKTEEAPNRNTRKPPKTTQEQLIDDVEEMKVKLDLMEQFDPTALYLMLAAAFILSVTLGVYVFSLRQKVSRLQGIIENLSRRASALHDKLFDIEGRLMRIPEGMEDLEDMGEPNTEESEKHKKTEATQSGIDSFSPSPFSAEAQQEEVEQEKQSGYAEEPQSGADPAMVEHEENENASSEWAMVAEAASSQTSRSEEIRQMSEEL